MTRPTACRAWLCCTGLRHQLRRDQLRDDAHAAGVEQGRADAKEQKASDNQRERKECRIANSARTTRTAVLNRSAPTTSHLRVYRSPSGPASGVSRLCISMDGARTDATFPGDPVASRIHQARAMFPHESPTIETIWPNWKSQKSLPRVVALDWVGGDIPEIGFAVPSTSNRPCRLDTLAVSTPKSPQGPRGQQEVPARGRHDNLWSTSQVTSGRSWSWSPSGVENDGSLNQLKQKHLLGNSASMWPKWREGMACATSSAGKVSDCRVVQWGGT